MHKKSSGKDQSTPDGKADRNKLSLQLNNSSNSKGGQTKEINSPVGEGLVGLRWIDDTGSEENLLDSRFKPRKKSRDDEAEVALLTAADVGPVVTAQPVNAGLQPYCPPGLEPLLETGQLVVHLGNFRKDITINKEPLSRMEVIDETRKVLLHVEQVDDDLETKTSFEYKLYNEQSQEVIRVFSPSSSTCLCCGASWHCMKRCRFQAIIYTPTGVVAGFVRRSRTKLVQEFEILDSNEQRLLALRGCPDDLVVHSADFQDEIGRLSVRGWVGIMHEVRRTSRDYGLTFPIDLDVRAKAVLIGALFAIHWLYSTKGGKQSPSKKKGSSKKNKSPKKKASAEKNKENEKKASSDKNDKNDSPEKNSAKT